MRFNFKLRLKEHSDFLISEFKNNKNRGKNFLITKSNIELHLGILKINKNFYVYAREVLHLDIVEDLVIGIDED